MQVDDFFVDIYSMNILCNVIFVILSNVVFPKITVGKIWKWPPAYII